MNKSSLHQLCNVFADEINIMVEEIDPRVLLLSTEEILIANQFQIPIKFTGYGRIQTLLQAIDETEFHYNILSFFNRYGKILLESKQIDGVFYQTIVLSYYNIDTNDIDIIRAESKNRTEGEQYLHLFWLHVIKKNINDLISQLYAKQQTSAKIKIGSQKFKELINNAKTDTTGDSGD